MWLALAVLPPCLAQPVDEVEAQLRLKQAAEAEIKAEGEIDRVREALAEERKRVLASDVERQASQDTVAHLQKELNAAQDALRARQDALKAARETLAASKGGTKGPAPKESMPIFTLFLPSAPCAAYPCSAAQWQMRSPSASGQIEAKITMRDVLVSAGKMPATFGITVMGANSQYVALQVLYLRGASTAAAKLVGSSTHEVFVGPEIGKGGQAAWRLRWTEDGTAEASVDGKASGPVQAVKAPFAPTFLIVYSVAGADVKVEDVQVK
ncbi:MAG TPA: hypothetical protein VMI56_03045 [Reyranella sp.]|nr:hypothetical protein [Reyranella sp.]